ncbi:Hypothetical protein HVR_LOCUS1210 [uncultured virus]|nr:Hypothetical protein HVR_LOCUS1210 [uncultured virus]
MDHIRKHHSDHTNRSTLHGAKHIKDPKSTMQISSSTVSSKETSNQPLSRKYRKEEPKNSPTRSERNLNQQRIEDSHVEGKLRTEELSIPRRLEESINTLSLDLSHSTKASRKSNKDYRRSADKKDNFPNGYLEDWNSLEFRFESGPSQLHSWNNKSSTSDEIDNRSSTSSTASTKSNKQSQQKNGDRKTSKFASQNISKEEIKETPKEKLKEEPKEKPKEELKESIFKPVSIILSTQDNILLNKDNSYDIRFSTGMVEGSGLYINEFGNKITFDNEGSYRFEISGEATPFSDINVKLVFYSELFPDDVKSFSETDIPKDENKLQLRGLATILPIQTDQNVIVRLVPTPDESIVLMANTRLIIHRVA